MALTLTAQVVPQGGGVKTSVASVVAEGLVARKLVGDDKILTFDHHRADEDGQQGYGDQQQDGEGGARVDVGAHQAHNQTQHQDDGGVQHCAPVALGKHLHSHRHGGLCDRRRQAGKEER